MAYLFAEKYVGIRVKIEELKGERMKKPLPIGIDDFKKLRDNDFYYTDKTLFIKELLDKRSEVSLFTRPRRFGKTLELSMVKYFFESVHDPDGCSDDNSSLFKGLKIMDAGERYTRHLGQYPVICISLKSARQPDFEKAFIMLKRQIADEFRRHKYVTDSLEESDKLRYNLIMNETDEDAQYLDALAFLSRILNEYHKRKVIILMDEYDVPLENAYFKGFYDKMTDFIRSLFESALKTNPNLEFAVITGCLRISKESIFTGLNNLEIISIMNTNYAEYFGFTQEEVECMLSYYGIEEKKEEAKKWYDGYFFGNTEVYNPWSVINYVKAASADHGAFPKPYWANTSSNSIVRELVERADSSVKQEMEELIAGGTIEKPVHEDITYDEVYKTEDNLWNFLFFTGYLKKQSERFDGETIYLTLALPNTEVKLIYRNTILDWFNQNIKKKDFSALYRGILQRETDVLEREISKNLMETISFFDYKEDYYHGFLAGLLKMMDGYILKSNRESGLGRSDLLLLSPAYEGVAVIMELKIADSFAQLNDSAHQALCQIKEKKYDAELKLEGYHTFIYYGISFFKKLCRVIAE